MVMSDETALVIDGSNFLWKAYAAPFEFKSNNGVRLDVITVFMSLLRSCVDYVGADKVVVVFDHPAASNFRLDDKDYKSNRVQDFSQEVDSPFHHLDNLKRVLSYMNVIWLESDLAEADDIISTLADLFDGRVYIASSDTDFYQCISDRVGILKVRGSKNIEVLDKVWLGEKLDIEPEDYVYFKALTGDKADNIVGIKGVGPKTASRIVNDSAFAKRYDEFSDLISKNITLIGLKQVDSLDFNWDECRVDEPLLRKSNRDIFDSLGF